MIQKQKIEKTVLTADGKKVFRLTQDENALKLKEIIALRTGKRICDAINDQVRAKKFVSDLNTGLKEAGIPAVSVAAPIKEFMQRMLTIGTLDEIWRNEGCRNLGSDIIYRRDERGSYIPRVVSSNQLFASVPRDMTFAEANKSDNGKYHVSVDAATGEKYRIELPPILVDQFGSEVGSVKNKETKNYAISTKFDNISEIMFDTTRGENIILVRDISKWFAVELTPKNDESCFTMILDKGVFKGFAGLGRDDVWSAGIADVSNYLLWNDNANWLGAPAIMAWGYYVGNSDSYVNGIAVYASYDPCSKELEVLIAAPEKS